MVRPLRYGCKGALKVTIIKPIQHVIMWQAIEPGFGQVLALVAVSLCETLVAHGATATGDGLRVFGNCLSLPSAGSPTGSSCSLSLVTRVFCGLRFFDSKHQPTVKNIGKSKTEVNE